MRSVARDAGVALGLVNYYYADKAGLIKAALRWVEDQDVALVAPDPTAPPDERLRAALRRVADPEFLTTEYLALRLQLWALAQAHEYRSAYRGVRGAIRIDFQVCFRGVQTRSRSPLGGPASRPHAPREHLRLLRHSAARRRGRRLDQGMEGLNRGQLTRPWEVCLGKFRYDYNHERPH